MSAPILTPEQAQRVRDTKWKYLVVHGTIDTDGEFRIILEFRETAEQAERAKLENETNSVLAASVSLAGWELMGLDRGLRYLAEAVAARTLEALEEKAAEERASKGGDA